MIYKCKICGGQSSIDSTNGVVVCDYCGTKQALPLFTEESERLLYDRGNNYLLHGEYDKAENVFSQLLSIKPNAAELYWDLVLCKYGVTYVKDPKTGRYIPTCNRTHYTPIFSDKNYQKAISLSVGEKKALFESDAKTIDRIQKGIIEVSKKEKPFDIFISYKETDINGNRTKDSIKAQKLYEKLTESGYKVFFSRITLEDKVGQEYEPYIYAALYSSKVMLTICSSTENIKAAWVKNEWARFLRFKQNDSSKTLLPLYFDMDKSGLPDEFALLSAHNMNADGFEDELLRGIKKLIPSPVMKAKKRKKQAKLIRIATTCICILGIALASAYFINHTKQQAYANAQDLFSNAKYEEAAKEFKKLGNYKDSQEFLAKTTIQPEYDIAKQLYYDGKYAEATWAFNALGNYEDAAVQKEKSELSWRRSLANVVSDTDYTFPNKHYITPNGSVSDFKATTDTIKIGEHGKVVSIANGCGNLFVLYEDGIAKYEDNYSDTIFEDVVQILPCHWLAGDIVLKSDGTVHIAGLNDAFSEFPDFAETFSEVSKWKNIVMISAYAESGGNADFNMVLTGLDSDGNVHVCLTGLVFAEEIFLPDEFRNIKTLDSTTIYSYYYPYQQASVAALTNEGDLVTYVDGITTVTEDSDIVDVCFVYDDLYLLSADGKLRVQGSNRVVLNDVVEISKNSYNGYAITRNGTIYMLGDGVSNNKTLVHNEWLTKMG